MACQQTLGQGASCQVDEQCHQGLQCLRELCLRDPKQVWSPSGVAVPPGALVHMRAEVVHPHVQHGAVELTVEGAVSVGPSEFTMGDKPVRVSAPELRQQTYFDVKPWSVAVLADAWMLDGEIAARADGTVFVFTQDETRELMDGTLVSVGPGVTRQAPLFWNDALITRDGCRIYRDDAVLFDCETLGTVKAAAASDRLFIADGQIRAVSSDGALSTFAAVDARLIALAGSRMLAVTENEWLSVDLATGAVVWQIPAPFRVVSLAAADGDSVWAGSEDALFRVYLDGLGYVRFLAQGKPTRLAARTDGSVVIFDGAQPLLMRFAPQGK